jgi:hypothetical protein
MNRACALLLALVFVCGCGESLRTLMRLNSEQESHNKYVEQQTRKFEALLEDIEADNLNTGTSIKRITSLYGEPILIKDIDGRKRFLYREPLEYNPLKKVYLYFDQDKLSDFEVVEPDGTADEIESGLEEEYSPEFDSEE